MGSITGVAWLGLHISQIKLFGTQIKILGNSIVNVIISFLSWWHVLVIISSIAFFYRIISKSVRKRKKEEQEREYLRRNIAHLTEKVKETFRTYYDHHIPREQFIGSLKELYEETKDYGSLNEENETIKKRIKIEEYHLIEWNHRKAMMLADREIEEKKKEFRQVELKKEMLLEELETKKEKILEKLKSSSNRIFEKNKLSKKQKDTLLGDGYKFINEFSITEKRRIPVLIRPFGNHSFSHEFLVWDIKRLLVKTRGVRKIQEHLTKDADITFIFKNRTHALEVETGNLLSKHDQLKEKVKYLNRKYPQRWMFIVSHRDLAVKYKKFGLTSARNRVCEKLEKLLKIAHP